MNVFELRDRLVRSQLLLHRHQREAILKAHQCQHYGLTTGTGSGKSLATSPSIFRRHSDVFGGPSA